ncbi:MAG: hypothetical protein HY980_00395, partial [Candidatus Magasanikbacteria bacterium]|nr:hypothetical protein [Candidatus Magasanikbacteria bacterium]
MGQPLYNFTQNIDLGQNSDLTTVSWGETLPSGTDLQFQIRSATTSGGLASATWYGPTGIGDYYTTNTGENINSIHDGDRWIQYKAFLTTTNSANTPSLNDITVNYQYYPTASSYTLDSSSYNTESSANIISSLNWTESLPTNTDVKFQLRTSPDNSTWTDWLGPTGTGDYYTDPAGGETINLNHSDGLNDQWVQYRALLSTTDSLVTPTLSNFNLNYSYNIAPNAPFLISPTIGSATTDNTPTLSANYSDPDTGDTGATNYRIATSSANCLAGTFVAAGTSTPETPDNNENTTWTPTSSIGVDATYYWCAQNNDGVLTSAWTSMGNFILHTTSPTITSISSDKTNGSYKAGEVIDIDVVFSEAVTSTGNVTVTLETGDIDRTCVFIITNSTTGTCDYTVQSGDTSADLDATISGTIADQVGNPLTNYTSAITLAVNKNLVIDTTPPSVNAGSDAIASSTVNQNATVTGAATYLWSKQSGTGTITFGTPTAEDTTISSDTNGAFIIRLTAADLAGNPAYDEMTLVWDATTPNIAPLDAGASSIDRTSLTSDTWFKYSDTGDDDQISFSWTDPLSVSDDTFYYELNGISGDTITGDELNTTNPYIDSIAVSEGTNYFHTRPRNGALTWGIERIFIVKYDKTAPTGTTLAWGTISLDSIQATPSGASDSGSGLAALPYYIELDKNATSFVSVDANSGWVSDVSTFSTLNANEAQAVRVKTKDNVGNESGWITPTSAYKYTLADTPTNLIASTINTTDLTLTVDALPNITSGFSGYYFANTTNNTNSGWIQTNSWQESGLACATAYNYAVKYRNGDSIETSTIALSQTTLSCAGLVFLPPTPPITTSPQQATPTQPASLIINNNDQTTNTPQVILKLNAQNAIQMAISNSLDFNNISWETYQTQKNWTLTSNDGIKTVYAKFRSVSGGVSEIISDEIVLKTVPNENGFNPSQWVEPIVPAEVPTSETAKPETPETKTTQRGPTPSQGVGPLLEKPATEAQPPAGAPTQKPTKPFIERVPEFLKPLIPEFLKPKPPEIKLPEDILAAFPKELKKLIEKFPKFGETLKKVGITKVADIERLKIVNFTLPGLTER